MVVGEGQILGQVRQALRLAQSRARSAHAQRARPAGTAGRQARPHRDRHRPGGRLARSASGSPSPSASSARGGQAGPGGRRGLDERAGRRDAGARRASPTSWWPTAPTSAAVRLAQTVGGRAVEFARSAGGAGGGRHRHLLHRRDRRGHHRRHGDAPGDVPAGPGAAARHRPRRTRGSRRDAGRPGVDAGRRDRRRHRRRRACRGGRPPCARSSPRRSPPTCRPSAPPGSPRPWSRCAARRRRWSRPSWAGSSARLPELDGRVRDEVDPDRAGAWSTSCSTSPLCVSSSSRQSPAGDHYAEALRELFDLDPKMPER